MGVTEASEGQMGATEALEDLAEEGAEEGAELVAVGIQAEIAAQNCNPKDGRIPTALC